MSIWKRVITLVVVFMVLLSCLVSPASADAPDENIFNLMSPTNEYDCSHNSSDYFRINDNYFYFKNVSKMKVTWDTDVSPAVDEIHIVLNSSIDLYQFTAQVNNIDCEFRFRGRYGYDYYITLYVPDKLYMVENITLAFEWNNYVDGRISIVSAFAYCDDVYPYTSCMVYTQDLIYMENTSGMKRIAYESKAAYSFPMAPFNHITEWQNVLVDPLMKGLVWIYNYSGDLPFDRAESITYVLSTCGDIVTGDNSFAFYLMDDTGDPKLVLPTSSVVATPRNLGTYFGSENMQWPLYTYTITVDTSNVDLTDYYAYCLNFWIEPAPLKDVDSYSGWYLQIESIVARPLASKVPWYARFGKWINSGFDRVVEALGGNQSGALSQAGEKMKEDAGAISSAGDSLGAVSQPDVDSGALINNYVNFDPVGLSVLSCITSNPMVTSMLVVVFTFCLAGYIFFGKKR